VRFTRSNRANFREANRCPDNVIQLVQDNGDPFSLLSIDLAPNLSFRPGYVVGDSHSSRPGLQLFTDIRLETDTVSAPVTEPATAFLLASGIIGVHCFAGRQDNRRRFSQHH